MATLVFLGRGLNEAGWAPLEAIAAAHSHFCTVVARHEDVPATPDLGMLLGYERIVPEDVLRLPRLGFVLFHSSDLPRGRGWAPIYYTMTQRLPLVQTLLFAAPGVDEGNLIAKAHYPLAGSETEREVRRIDDALTLRLFEDSLAPLLAGKVSGKPQDSKDATWWPRRRPEDSAVDPARPLCDLVDHLRALPAAAPAFFQYGGRRFRIRLEAEDECAAPPDPGRIRIERFY